MTQSTVEFLEKLRQFVESEASAQYKQLERQWGRLGLGAFSSSFCGLKLVPTKWRCLAPPTSG